MEGYSELAASIRELNEVPCSEEVRDKFWSVALEKYLAKQFLENSFQRRLATVRLLDQLEKDALVSPEFADKKRICALKNEDEVSVYMEEESQQVEPSNNTGLFSTLRSRLRSRATHNKQGVDNSLEEESSSSNEAGYSPKDRPSSEQFSWVNRLTIFLLVMNVIWFVTHSLLNPNSALHRMRLNRSIRKSALDQAKKEAALESLPSAGPGPVDPVSATPIIAQNNSVATEVPNDLSSFCADCVFNREKMGRRTCGEKATFWMRKYKKTEAEAIQDVMKTEPENCKKK